MKKHNKIILFFSLLVIAGIVIIVIFKLTAFEPVNPDTVKSVHVQIANLTEYSFDVNLSQRDSVKKIAEFESLVNDKKGVNGLVNTVTWRISITYSLQTGREINRAYKGQDSTNDLISSLKTIDELVEQNVFN